MGRFKQLILMVAAAFLLASCSGGMVRRVSEPAASIQQLTVRPDGSWSVDVRINNFSSIPMRFEAIALRMSLGSEQAGTLNGNAGISIGPESADVVTVIHSPTPSARIVMADALAAQRSIGYVLKGTINATPEEGKPRDYDIDRTSSLSPVPGLPGVMR